MKTTLPTGLSTASPQGRSIRYLAMMLVGCVTVASSCEEPRAADPARTAPKQDTLPVIADGRGLLFSFFDTKAELRTVDSLGKVESTAVASVLVVDPKRMLEGDRVFVADLRKESPSTGFAVRIERRGAWLARTMPKLSQLKEPVKLARADTKKPRRKRRRRPRARRKPAQIASAPVVAPVPVAPAPRRAQVLLFSTSWCPSCRQAKAFFIQKRVQFVELDIEKDPRAARQYSAICQARGLRPGAVPLIVVGKQVFMGFSRFKIELALNQLG